MLTERQQQILDFVRAGIEEAGVAPSLREIARRFDVSYGTVQSHLEALRRKGYVEPPDSRHRGTRPVHWKASIMVPLLGHVQAGLPVLAEQNIDSYLSVDRDLARNGPLFALKVKGDSMRDASILEGDTVIVRRQDTAQNGDIVVALNEGEATVKYWRSRRNEWFLEPANPAFHPFPAMDFSIIGKVVGLVRAFGT
jgi:repressor LexA